MNKIPDFTRLISSPPFTFLVGKDHTKLTIQSGLAKHVSRPLDDLMNNGHTRESKHRIAVLEDEEVEVFTAFTQYAYTGNYTVPVVQQKSELPLPPPLPPAPVAPAPAPAPELSPASSGRRSGSGSVRSAQSGGTIMDGGRNNSSSNSNQQLLQLQHDNIPIRTLSSASSFLPPPAPTPPPFDRNDSKQGRRYVETPLALTAAAADEWENPFAHSAEPASFREDTPPVEVIKNENDVLQVDEVVAAADDDKELERPLFLLSKRLSKKDKKKNKRKGAAAAAAVFEDTVSKSLTPPSTPPFDVREIKAETPPRRENRLEIEQHSHDYDADCAIETDPGEPDEAVGDEDGDWWDQPVSPGRRRERGREQDREFEDRIPNVRRPLPQPVPQQQQQQREMPLIDTSFATTSQRISPTPRKKGANTWNEFASLDYFHQQHDHHSDIATTPKPAPAPAQTTIIIVPYILFHAKVYVFATRFLIPGLAQLCLQKLHTSLLDYPLTPVSDADEDENDSPKNDTRIEALKFSAHAKMFLDILRYTYEHTTRFEPESPTAATQLRECELRKLVAQYAACKMRELAVYTPSTMPRVPSSPSHGPGSGVSVVTAPGGGLRELLDRMPELASDLVFLMM